MQMKKNQLKVISFNAFASPFHGQKIIRSFLRTRVRLRLKLIADALITEKADIISFQEIHLYHHFYLLRKYLTEYPYVAYHKNWYGPRGGLAIFAKVPIATSNYIDFTSRGQLWNKSITGPLSKKGLLCITLKDLDILIINTHLMQNSERNWRRAGKYPKLLQAQLTQIMSVIADLPSKTPVLLMGDFNIPKSLALYKKFMQDSGLNDAFSAFDFPTYQGDILKDAVPEGRIDYIFYTTPSLSPSTQEHLFTKQVTFKNNRRDFLSDHMALSCIFTHKT